MRSAQTRLSGNAKGRPYQRHFFSSFVCCSVLVYLRFVQAFFAFFRKCCSKKHQNHTPQNECENSIRKDSQFCHDSFFFVGVWANELNFRNIVYKQKRIQIHTYTHAIVSRLANRKCSMRNACYGQYRCIAYSAHTCVYIQHVAFVIYVAHKYNAQAHTHTRKRQAYKPTRLRHPMHMCACSCICTYIMLNRLFVLVL